MPKSTSSAGNRLRAAAVLFGLWIVFFVLMRLLSVALAPTAAERTFEFGAAGFFLAAVWTALTLGIAEYHQWLRRRVSSVITLIAAHLPLLVFVGYADAESAWWSTVMSTGTAPRLTIAQLMVFYADFDLVAYVVVVAVAEVLSVRAALAERERQAERLASSLARARLDYLEAQLQPHFLFNSLGAISELAYDAPAAASRVVRQLASIFRTALGRTTDEITLGDELLGIEPYLDIQRIRFADWLTIEYRIDDAAVDCLVPRFVLQPLIENAIRHGLSGRRAAGTIEISATVAGTWLIVRVTDNGVGLEGVSASSGRGIGLANVRDRLGILYGDDESLRLSSSETGGAVAELRIPARRRGAAAVVIEDDVATPPTELAVVVVDRAAAIPDVLRRPLVAIAGSWLLTGLVWTQQSYVYLNLRGRLNGATLWSLARNDMFSAVVWAVLTPVIFAVARRFPLRRSGLIWRAPVYAVFAAIVVLAHNVVWQRVIAPAATLFAPQYQMSFIVGFLVVCVVVAIAHYETFALWLRERDEAYTALRAELGDARARAEKVQAIPPMLLRALDGIGETAERDPALTERQLARLADYLRLALECTDERGVTPDRQLALDTAVAELHLTDVPTLTVSA